jgi:hypothetical protein
MNSSKWVNEYPPGRQLRFNRYRLAERITSKGEMDEMNMNMNLNIPTCRILNFL